MELLINIFKGEDYFIGTIKQFPEVVTQGKSVTSTIKNLADALHLYMEDITNESTPIEEFS